MNILRFQDGGQTPDVRVFTKEYFNKDNKIGLVGTKNQFDGKYNFILLTFTFTTLKITKFSKCTTALQHNSVEQIGHLGNMALFYYAVGCCYRSFCSMLY